MAVLREFITTSNIKGVITKNNHITDNHQYDNIWQ